MRFLNYTILVIIYFTLVSCETKMIDLDLTIVTNSKLAESPDEPLPPMITDILNPIECKVNDTVYIPHITIQRTDLAVENYVIENPISAEGKTRKFLKTYSYADLKNDYEEIIPTLKAGEYLSKTTSKTPNSPFKPEGKNNIIFYLSENNNKQEGYYKSIKEIRSHLDSLLCTDKSYSRKKIYIMFDNVGDDPPPPPPPDTTVIGGCTLPTVTDGLDLKQDMLQIIAAESINERVDLARQVYENYMSKNAIVERHKFVGDNNQDVWDPGQGINYFTNRLATLESITDISIFRVDHSKKEPGKFSGIYVIECHDMQELQ